MTLLRRLAWSCLALAFGHIVFGAIVRITGSGMGCGDHWPRCHGAWFPPLDRPDLVIEVSHRYFAATLTAAIVALLAVAVMRRGERGVGGRGGVLRAAALSAGLVVTAALFGALTVVMELANKPVIVTHLALAMSLLAALVVTATRAGGPPRLPIYGEGGSPPASSDRTPHHGDASWSASPYAARHASIAAAVTFAAIVLGGLTAHLPGANSACPGFPLCGDGLLPSNPSQHIQYAHRILAFALFFHLGWLGVVLMRRGERRLASVARTLLTLTFFQVMIAATMIGLQLPAVWRSLHEAAGTLLWIGVFWFAYATHRLAHPHPGSAPAPNTPGAGA